MNAGIWCYASFILNTLVEKGEHTVREMTSKMSQLQAEVTVADADESAKPTLSRPVCSYQVFPGWGPRF